MAKNEGERFAKIVLAELAEMHALILGIVESQIFDAATRPDAEVSDAATKRIHARIEAKKDEMAKKIYHDLLKKLDLPQ